MTEARERVHIVTHGCKVNQADSDLIADAIAVRIGDRVLAGDDADATPGPADDADVTPGATDDPAVVVLNTCTVTAEADRKARKAVRHALALPSRPTVIVTGCLAALDPTGLRTLGKRVCVEPDRTQVAERVADLLNAGPAPEVSEPPSARVPRRARVQVKVQDGCDARCSYCIVPQARGVARSVPFDQVVAAVRHLAEAGVAEAVLTGVNIGKYDDAGRRLSHLLAAIGETGIPRVRLSSIEPGDVDEALLAVASSSPSFCRHLHIPLQSGCDRTLAAMDRPYDRRAFEAVLNSVRAALPGLAVSTDVIAGFPGESAVDAAESLAFVEHSGFSRLHVFRYSPRPGTRAASHADQVAPAERSARARALRECGATLSERFAHERLGATCELLVERCVDRAGRRCAEGTTREYVHVMAEVPGAEPGDLVQVNISAVDAAGRVVGCPARWPNGIPAARAW